MKINDNEAQGYTYEDDKVTMIKAVRRPNSDVKITREIWMKGKNEDIMNIINPLQVILHEGLYLDYTIKNIWKFLGIREVRG